MPSATDGALLNVLVVLPPRMSTCPLLAASEEMQADCALRGKGEAFTSNGSQWETSA